LVLLLLLLLPHLLHKHVVLFLLFRPPLLKLDLLMLLLRGCRAHLRMKSILLLRKALLFTL
jgi:hypothetical protein